MAGKPDPKCTCILAPPPGEPAGTAPVLTVIDPDCPHHRDLTTGRVTPATEDER